MLVQALLLFLGPMLIGVIPIWPHSRGWGYLPATGIGLILCTVVVCLLLHIV